MKYELTAYELSFINGAFVIVGALVGVLVSYWLARYLASYNSKLSAAADLRASFAPIITRIKTGQLTSDALISDAAYAAFDTNTIEMERFSFYVCKKNKEAYNEACKEYRRMVCMRPLNHGSALHVTDFYIEKVDNILKYTKV